MQTYLFITGCAVREARLISTLNSHLLKSHYDVLGIAKNCTGKQVKEAYFKLSKIYHPDRNDGSPEAAEKFRDITEAYEVLKNPTTRKEYDRDSGPAGFEPRPRRSAPDPEVVRPMYPTGKIRFDVHEWDRMHYGEQTQRRQRARAQRQYEEYQQHNVEVEKGARKQVVVMLVLFFVGFAIMNIDFLDKDDPKRQQKSDRR